MERTQPPLQWILPWRWPAWAWLAGLFLVLFIRFPINFLRSQPFLMDLEVYRAVAQRIAHGGGAELYQPTASDVMMFKYAPCWALLWLPLAWLSAHQAAVVWSCATVAWLLLACHQSRLLCHAADLPTPGWIPIAVTLLLVRSLTEEFYNGQVNVLWGLLVVWFHSATLRRRPWSAALALALAISLKLPALIILGYLIVRRRWPDAGRACLVLCAINLAASVILAPHSPLGPLCHWLHVLRSSGASRAFEIGSQSLLALLGRLLTADGYRFNVAVLSHAAVARVWLAISAALFALTCAGPRARQRRRFSFDVALLSVLMVLCSPTTWLASYSALVWPVSVGCALTVAGWHQVRPRLPILASAALLCLLSVMMHSGFWRSIGIRSLRTESYVFLVLVIPAWFALALFALLWSYRTARWSPVRLAARYLQ